MKRNVLVSALALCFLAMGTAAFGRGESCSFPIELGKDYQTEITKPGTYWYKANTFDLPLAVYFSPDNEDDVAPEIEMDFSCTPGVYTDSIICSLFCANSGSGVSMDMPHKPKLNKEVKDGKVYYYLSMGQAYRDLLLKAGIDYNVEVYVKVTYKNIGTMAIAPDDMFSDCMDGYKFMHLGDTVRVVPNDKERHVIVPFIQWSSDSIRFVWDGQEPVDIRVATGCEFDPTDFLDETVLVRKTATNKDTVKLTSENLSYYANIAAGGMLYAKFYSKSAGVLKIERVPMAPPAGDAKLLKYDKAVSIAAHDTLSLYAIPVSWDTATVFTTPTDYTFRMYVGLSPEFIPSTAVDSFKFDKTANGHMLGLKTAQMKALCAKAQDNYLYVRFRCAAKTTVTPNIWKLSDCLVLTQRLEKNSQITLAKNEKVSYGLYYNAFKDGDLTLDWGGTDKCKTGIGDACDFKLGSTSFDHVIDYLAISKKSSWTISKADLASWADRVDSEGYLYIIFQPLIKGTMKIISNAPEEKDPEIVLVSQIILEPTTTVLSDVNPTAYIKTTVLPANATNPSLKWEITNGADLVTWKLATYAVTRNENAEEGNVTITASATDGSGVSGSANLTIKLEETGITNIASDADYSRIVLRDGAMYIELNRAGSRMLYDMTGRRVE